MMDFLFCFIYFCSGYVFPELYFLKVLYGATISSPCVLLNGIYDGRCIESLLKVRKRLNDLWIYSYKTFLSQTNAVIAVLQMGKLGD